MTLPLPPIAEQQHIVALLDRADEVRTSRQASLGLLRSLKESIFLDRFGDPATNAMGYDTAALGDLAIKFSDGPFGSNLKSSHYVEEGIRVIRLQNIGVGEFVNDNAAYISDDHFFTLRKHECLPGDVLVGTLGDPNLRACIQPLWLARALNKADCVQIRVDRDRITPEWLVSLLNLPATLRLAQGLVLGQTRSRISMGRLRTLNVPVPPLDEQHRFVDLVKAVQATRVHSVQSADAIEELVSSLQRRAFAGQL